MTDCKTQIAFGFHPNRDVVGEFSSARISSDGGLLLIRQVDEKLGISQALSQLLPDTRDANKVSHSRLEQVRQRLYQICLGYQDCNDADWLRTDPVFKTVCDLLPDSSAPLSSQPTLSRFENAIDGRSLVAMRNWFEQSYVDGLDENTDIVVLDIDSTDDPTHGRQQLSFFHGFYDQHMFHPLLVIDANNGQLASVLLRPGNAHASRGAGAVLERLIRRIKQRFPKAQIAIRGDSAFCMPNLLDRLERLNAELGDIDYIIGIAKNPRLLALAAPLMERAQNSYEQTKAHARLFDSFHYASQSWPQSRYIIAKAEHSRFGANPRFVVSTIEGFDPKLIYERGYCKRGQCENNIKDFKNALHADRLSCSAFKTNALRLILHAFAYRLMFALRQAAASIDTQLGAMQFDTLRLRLLKVAACVVESARRIVLRLPRSFPFAAAFSSIATLLYSS